MRRWESVMRRWKGVMRRTAVLGRLWSRLPRAATVAVAIVMSVGVLAPVLAPHPPNRVDLDEALQGMSWAHPLGTDDLGRDELSRLLVAAQTTLTTVTIVVAGAIIVGAAVGVLAGSVGGVVDEFLMRLTDIAMSIPSLVVALAVLGAIGPGYGNMILALTLAWWPAYARLARSVIVSVRHQPYIEALQVLGARPGRIFIRHLVPAAIGPTLVYASGDAGMVALAVATLSFLGLGVKPPRAEWGQMLVDGMRYLETEPMLVILPGLALSLLVVTFNVFSRSVATKSTPRRPVGRALRRRVRALPPLEDVAVSPATRAGDAGSAEKEERIR